MLRFFESEVDSWWSMAATPPPPPPCHYVELPVDPRLQVIDHYNESGTAPPMNIAPAACRRVPSALTTADLVKGRWSPATVVSNGSSLSSPNSSSSVDSMNSYGGCGIISWQSSNAFSIESAIDPYIAPFKVDRSSSIAMDSGRSRRNQHEVVVDLRQHRRKLDENKNIEAVLIRDSKRQKTGVQEGNLHCFTSFESTSSSPSMMMTAEQNLKAPLKRSQKLGDKITALQQLVSPFGKADTASVLHEAALYIKALHEQVKLLSKPYVESISAPEGIQGMKNGADNCHYRSSSLRREGLCMVPISPSVINLANQELLDSHMTASLLR
ncbi:hypothetical protein KFK09_010461 [Dendrobium nobile]|uniref:BHLH domain-containing protein n=1 Tax=Dendrobium nobile TaxID=94219 RepID=A0A8T3BBS2_DENNO|nr:hypothetical protein KFK09_010461 [Dendrobium nobile]